MIFERKIKKILLTAVLFVSLLFIAFGADKVSADGITASDNIYIENVCVAGRDEAGINQAIQDKLWVLGQDIIKVNVGAQSIEITAAEFGINYTNTDVTAKILNLGKKGNIWDRYKMEHYFENGEPVVFGLTLAVDENMVRSVVEQKISSLNIQRRDMTLEMGSDGELYPSDKVDGLYVDVDKTTAAIVEYMNKDWHGGYGEINAFTVDDPAAGNAETYSQVKDVLGKGATVYTVDEENAARNINLAVGASKINGTIVYPGEEFSTIDHLMPFTAEAGYAEAGTYVDGQVVDDIGGGACQVSTTLYRAVIEAELKVTERCAHSMIVGYVEPSMDAAVAEGVKDFKFVNDTDAPVYITGYAGDGIVAFTIYGHETRDPARSIGFESEVLTETDIETRMELDSSLEFGKIETSQGHKGMTAVSYKIVYMNGEEVSREQLNFSEYKKSDQIYYIGIAGASQSDISLLSDAAAKKDVATIYAVTNTWPSS